MSEDYRSIILQRLRNRDRKCDAFTRVIQAHFKLFESFNHLASIASTNYSEKKKLPFEDSEKALKLNTELSEVYKQNAINNQRLIDTNSKLAELENTLLSATKERDAFLNELDEKRSKLHNTRLQCREYKGANELLNDELIASETLYNTMNDKLLRAQSEHAEYKIRIEKLTERNEELKKEFKTLDQTTTE